MGLRQIAIAVLLAAVLPACVRPGPEPASPSDAVRALARCYEVTIHFDSAGMWRWGRAFRHGIYARDVHPDSSGLGGGYPVWIDTLKLDARVLRHDTADARGVHYRLSGVHFPRKRGDEWPLSASWQARLDTVWVDISDTFVHSSDSLLVRRDELRGIRTYATDGMEVYYATLRYRPLGLRCPGGGVPAS